MGYRMKMIKVGNGFKVSKNKIEDVSLKKPEVLKETRGKAELEKLVLRENPKKFVSFR
jgi:hypothetical protein